MTLTLVTGRAHAGKSGLVFEHVAKAAAEGRPAVVLLPTFADVIRAREEMAARIPVGVEISSLDTWIETAWSLRGDGRRIVDEATRRYLVRGCCEGEATALGPSALTPGFARLMNRVVEQVAGEPLLPADDSQGEAIARIVTKYREGVAAAGMIELGEAVRLLAPGSGFGQGAAVAAHRMTNIGRTQERALLAAAEANDVLVAVVWERGFPATECNDGVVSRLAACASEIVNVATAEPESELQRLECDLFRPAEPHETTGAVILGEATGLEAEAALVAGQVSRALSDGFAPDRIAVCFRNLSGRASLLAAALTAECVPFEFDLATKWALTPLGRSLSALVRLGMGEGSRQDALEFASGVHSGLSHSVAEDLDRRWRRGRVESPRTLLRALEAAGDSSRRSVELAQRCAAGERGVWQELAAHLLRVGLVHAARRPAMDLGLDAGANQAIADADRAAREAGVDPRADDFLAAVSAVRVSTGAGEREGAVLVTEAHRLRSRRFDVLVIGGLSASEFAAESREPLFEEIVGRLCGEECSPERASERLLFYSLATRPRQRLVLTRPATTADGAAVRPSVFWDEVVDLYRTADQTRCAEEGRLTPTVTARLADLAAVAPAFAPQRRRARERAAAGELPTPAAHRGTLARQVSLAPPDGEYRVTEIEKYHACPYSWFFDTRLRTGELDGEFGARERGTFAHAMNQAFYREWWESGRSRVEPADLPEALQLLESVAAKESETLVTRGLAESVQVHTATHWVRSAIEADAELFCGYEPIAFEWEFGQAKDRAFSFGSTLLRGSVDRVDRGAPGLIVVDYKSSSADGYGSWVSKGLLQTVVYGAAVSRLLGTSVAGAFYRAFSDGAVRGWNGGDVPLPKTGIAKDVGTADEFKVLVEWAEQVVADAVSGIEAGDIAPRPRTARACAFCSARPFCPEGAR